MVGLLTYAIGYVALTAWDEHVLPKLQDAKIVPVIPGSSRDLRERRLSVEQRELPW